MGMVLSAADGAGRHRADPVAAQAAAGDGRARMRRRSRERIAGADRGDGPITVADYMALCLADPDDGYYTTREPFGAAGDFVTAPEISQMFGELIGVWAAPRPGRRCGRPCRHARRARPRPRHADGRPLRALASVPGFLAAAPSTWSRPARFWRGQQAALPRRRPHLARGLATCRTARLIVIANEFFDALPVRQSSRRAAWRERWSGSTSGRAASVAGRAPDRARGQRRRDILEAPAARALRHCWRRRGRRHRRRRAVHRLRPRKHRIGDTLQAVQRPRCRSARRRARPTSPRMSIFRPSPAAPAPRAPPRTVPFRRAISSRARPPGTRRPPRRGQEPGGAGGAPRGRGAPRRAG